MEPLEHKLMFWLVCITLLCAAALPWWMLYQFVKAFLQEGP